MKPSQASNQDLSKIGQDSEKQDDLPKNNQKKLSRWLLILLVLGGGIGSWQILKPSSVTSQAQVKESETPAKPVTVETLTTSQAVQKVKLLGQVEAGQKATLSSQIDGTIEQILVKEGDRISEGQVVAVLDIADAKIALAQAKAKLAQEQSNLDRLQVGTRPEIIAQRQAQLQSALAREKEAENNLASLIALQPDLIKQKQAELQATQAREKETQDNLKRITTLSEEGAISERILVEAQSAVETAVNERLRAESALQAQKTQASQDIAQGRTNLDNIRSEKLRLQASLAEAKAGPTIEEIEAQKGLVKLAQAQVQQAELALQRTEIKAPFAGIIQARQVDTGDYVEINDPLFTLVSDKSVDIFLEIPENISGQVTPGMRVNLSARALPDWQDRTIITAVIPTADTASRRQSVRVTLGNPPPQLVPGMAIQADLEMPLAVNDGFVVSRDALTRRGNKWLLFAVEDGKAKQLEVEMVNDLGSEVIIANAQLEEGKSIVVKGGDGLRHDTAIKIVE
ncbi:efflux RND transporter periplasmic adaptor subunit [Cyanobacterium sp. Dongsha4]|uniref:efflux RND transporter periplasmic adaptor subunit n=1 Tax=Cyanobacterium sp. DS4 TaxID=2878255 RepID=UPI002E823F23|nr:efflux RND transporter periplasmic adaptor subunit [Cyanobacterium sp. Dongsha4]WVL01153.1 efflux RND transporter periplasmic adaptor subunit [Cyanobacterium sp. Dongsha4]